VTQWLYDNGKKEKGKRQKAKEEGKTKNAE